MLVARLVVYALSAGSISFARPATVFSNSHPAQRGEEPYLLFLREVGARLPRGSVILLIRPGANPADSMLPTLLATSALPEQEVLGVTSNRVETRRGPAAPYAAVFGGELHTPSYRLLQRFPQGTLWIAIR